MSHAPTMSPIRRNVMKFPARFFGGTDGRPDFDRQDAGNPRLQQAPGNFVTRNAFSSTHHAASPTGFVRRSGIVIAATPTTTQASPIHTVELNCSPRKITLAATPIGTRR